MRQAHFRCRRFVAIVLLFAVACLTTAGCGKSNPVDGTYRDSSGMMTLYLHSGKADITAAGLTREAEYQIAGNTITVRWPNGHMFSTFTVNTDGSLTDGTATQKWTKS
jgi:hypothetical protein